MLAEQGQAEEGIAEMRHALGFLQTLGIYWAVPLRLGHLARRDVGLVEAYGRQGMTQAGLAVVAEALATAERIGERWYDAELNRLKGELLLQQSGSGVPMLEREGEAERSFLRAIDIARGKNARFFELRAAMSLARLQQRRGKEAYP